MNKRWSLSLFSKTVLALLWFAFTLAMVGWWWVYSLRQTEFKDSAHRMFFWEGSSLIAFVIVGGGMLVFLTHRDERRHERLKFFFSNFTHDIKTSIARLQLQAEVLKEQTKDQDPVFQRLVNDVQRLDLQLENSLWFANLEESSLFLEDISLVQVLDALKHDFTDYGIHIEGDAQILADRRALNSVLRNLLQNSVAHGKAKNSRMKITAADSAVKVLITDDGIGFSGAMDQLGGEVLQQQGSRGNGLGLLLSKKLLRKMKGNLTFMASTAGRGFQVEILLPRSRRGA